jgi:hypothetical protein
MVKDSKIWLVTHQGDYCLTQVISAELQLVAILGFAKGARHHSGIIAAKREGKDD